MTGVIRGACHWRQSFYKAIYEFVQEVKKEAARRRRIRENHNTPSRSYD
ncbi:MAG: hypothetical protein KDA74_11985 [Planctomycetaceae bacterium]|nr:hypothetical protein [Planctomycetaceae bacterium]